MCMLQHWECVGVIGTLHAARGKLDYFVAWSAWKAIKTLAKGNSLGLWKWKWWKWKWMQKAELQACGMQPQINFSGSACWHQNPIKFYKPCNCFRKTGLGENLTSSSATVACPWAQLKLKVAPCGRHSGALRGPPGLLNNNNAVNYSWMGVGCIKRE